MCFALHQNGHSAHTQLACLYWKFDPLAYQACRGRKLRTSTLDDDPLGVTPQQWASIKGEEQPRLNSTMGWYHIWDILFQDASARPAFITTGYPKLLTSFVQGRIDVVLQVSGLYLYDLTNAYRIAIFHCLKDVFDSFEQWLKRGSAFQQHSKPPSSTSRLCQPCGPNQSRLKRPVSSVANPLTVMPPQFQPGLLNPALPIATMRPVSDMLLATRDLHSGRTQVVSLVVKQMQTKPQQVPQSDQLQVPERLVDLPGHLSP
ncbi:hypothetical protein QBC36DRAFT_313804 [Triangularia setosa]|uniref:Uncharacterized protein n=1 Tax=Triangularia setosa TaxID=2587417 RepID=A0AAN6W141_9PEZI|nr:hypothetical protein QBC36DRAFT_313804 [Podospora setosa]